MPPTEWPLTGDDFKTAVNLRTEEVLRKDQDGKWNLDDGTDAETEKD